MWADWGVRGLLSHAATGQTLKSPRVIAKSGASGRRHVCSRHQPWIAETRGPALRVQEDRTSSLKFEHGFVHEFQLLHIVRECAETWKSEHHRIVATSLSKPILLSVCPIVWRDGIIGRGSRWKTRCSPDLRR